MTCVCKAFSLSEYVLTLLDSIIVHLASLAAQVLQVRPGLVVLAIGISEASAWHFAGLAQQHMATS